MKITKRDIEILNFLKEVCVADTKTISILFFNSSIRRCNQRMKILKDNKKVKCFRENILSPNIYYNRRKPTNLKHKLVCGQLIASLKQQNIEVLKYRIPFKIGQIIADMVMVVRINGKIKIYFCEIERTKKLDKEKYLDLYFSRKWKKVFPIMPSILVISDKNINTDYNVLDIKKCKYDLSDLSI